MAPNCPFYGRYLALLGEPFLLLDTKGNQCALVRKSTAPCYMEVERKPIDWRECLRVIEIRVGLDR